jgi:hypothetical protein
MFSRASTRYFLPSLALVLLSGCTYLVNPIAKKAADVQTRRLSLPVNRAPAFQECLNNLEGQCPTGVSLSTFLDSSSQRTNPFVLPLESPTYDQGDVRVSTESLAVRQMTATAANMAVDVLNHDFHKQLVSLFNYLRGGDVRNIPSLLSVEARKITLTIPLEEIRSYQEEIEAVTLIGGWDALAAVTEADPYLGARNAYLKAYFKAYFRDGKFFRATIDRSALLDRLAAKLKEEVPGLEDDEYQKLAKKLFPEQNLDENGDKYVFGKIADTGLITRDGSKLAFPGLEVSAALGSSEIETPKIDYIAVGSDLIRVLLQASFDSALRVPAVSNATGLSDTIPEPLRLRNAGGTDAYSFNVTEEEFGDIKTRSTQIEGVVSSGTGRLIRGLSLFSLNNEALATAIETAVGMAVSKPIEKVLWCWYECGLNGDMGTDQGYLALQAGELVEVEIVVTGIEHTVEAVRGR